MGTGKNKKPKEKQKDRHTRQRERDAKNNQSLQPPVHVKKHGNSAPADNKAKQKKQKQTQVQIAATHGFRRAAPFALGVISPVLAGLASILWNDRHVLPSHIAMWASLVLAAAWFAIVYDNHVFKRRLPRKRAIIGRVLFGITFVIISLTARWYHNLPYNKGAAEFHAIAPVFNYDPGTVVGGITWKAPYRELRFTMANQSNEDFRNLDLVIKPDQPVVDFRQKSGIANVQIDWADPNNLELLGIRRDSTKGGNVATRLASTCGVRLRCDAIPSHSVLELVMATATVNERNEHFIKRLVNDDGVNWFGVRGFSDEMFLAPPEVRDVSIYGRYSIDDQKVLVDESIKTSTDASVRKALDRLNK
jgi:hypothetical protein